MLGGGVGVYFLAPGGGGGGINLLPPSIGGALKTGKLLASSPSLGFLIL